jgi:hypothetical protein
MTNPHLQPTNFGSVYHKIFSALSLLIILLTTPLTTAALSTTTRIFTLPFSAPNSWFENIAVRPSGLLLATRADADEIWQIDPATRSGALLVSVPGAFNVTGIAEVAGGGGSGHHPRRRGSYGDHGSGTETYVFVSTHVPEPLQIEAGTAKVWTLTFDDVTGSPTVKFLTAMPDAGFLNGVATWGPGRVLISDTVREVVYLLDVKTGEFTTPLTNLTGVNGVHAAAGYVYWADVLGGRLSRTPVDQHAVATGLAELLAADQPIDDFALAVDWSGAGRAYVGALNDNKVVEVTFGPAPSTEVGVKRVVAENLTGTGFGLCTIVVFGRRKEDKGLLYASASQGGGSAAIVMIDPSE